MHSLTMVQTPDVDHQSSNNAFDTQNKQEVVFYLHAACFSPLVSTLVKASNAGKFAYWVGLTANLVNQASTKVSGYYQITFATTQ